MNFDAIVIGSGPAGSTTALSLVRAGWSVALVEKAAFPRRKVCGEFMSATSIAVIERLGLGPAWRSHAGPKVRRLALFSGETAVPAPMPGASSGRFGRALGRDVLDELMTAAARGAGAALFQPARALAVGQDGAGQVVRIARPQGETELRAPVVVAAHGSWEPGALPTQGPKMNGPGDFLGFKAHFRGGTLDPDLMPLLFFPGGYGGMVHADAGRLSLSLCIRRDVLARARALLPGASASEAVLAHVLASCRGVRAALDGACLEGPWLAAGPIRPGIRPAYAGGLFRVGNVAGESHPIIAEGISMAIQSGWLLAAELAAVDARDPAGRDRAGRRYAGAWRSQFATRIRAASLFAAIAVHPRFAALAGAVVEAVPAMLTLGATLSGKTREVATGLRGSAG